MHFRKAYKDLKRVNDLGIQDSQVSKVEMMQELERYQTGMISEVKHYVTSNFYQCMSTSSFPNDVEQEESNQASGVVTITVKELQELRKLVTDLKNNRLTPQDDNTKQKNWKYCWKYGACSHVGRDCKYKADGHEDTATFNDRKGGSELRLKKSNKE